MCGIVYAASLNNRPVNNRVIDQFFKQRSRGYEGFGLFDNEYKNMVRSTTQAKILKWLRTKPSKEIMFHHRFSTSTGNVKNACHPFSTKDFFDTNYILVHNGVLHSDLEMHKDHVAMGIEYSSEQDDGRFNDSEALLWDFALYMEGYQDKMESVGSIAFICIALNEKEGDKLYYYRNTGNPLKVYKSKKALVLSSEGKGTMVQPDILHEIEYTSGKFDTQKLELPTYRAYDYSQNKSGNWGNNDYYDDENNWEKLTPEQWARMFEETEEEDDYVAESVGDVLNKKQQLLLYGETEKPTPVADAQDRLKNLIQKEHERVMKQYYGNLPEVVSEIEASMSLAKAMYDEEYEKGNEANAHTLAIMWEEYMVQYGAMSMVEQNNNWNSTKTQGIDGDYNNGMLVGV